MLRRLVALVLVAVPVAWLVDRWLAARGDEGAAPLEMLAVVDAPIEATWAVVVRHPAPGRMDARDEVGQRSTRPVPVRVGHDGARRRCGSSGSRSPIPSRSSSSSRRRRYAIRHLGLFSGSGLITLEGGADGTTTIVRWEERLEPPVLPALGAAVQAPILRSIFQADLARLKRLVETGSAA